MMQHKHKRKEAFCDKNINQTSDQMAAMMHDSAVPESALHEKNKMKVRLFCYFCVSGGRRTFRK